MLKGITLNPMHQYWLMLAKCLQFLANWTRKYSHQNATRCISFKVGLFCQSCRLVFSDWIKEYTSIIKASNYKISVSKREQFESIFPKSTLCIFRIVVPAPQFFSWCNVCLKFPKFLVLLFFQQKEQLKKLKTDLSDEITFHEEQIKRHQEAIARNKARVSELEKN